MWTQGMFLLVPGVFAFKGFSWEANMALMLVDILFPFSCHQFSSLLALPLFTSLSLSSWLPPPYGRILLPHTIHPDLLFCLKAELCGHPRITTQFPWRKFH